MIKKNSKFTGFVDYGSIVAEDIETPASEALLFMLVGLKSHWKCPIAYFLTDKADAETQSSLINSCLCLSADYGLRVWSVTSDGTSANLNMLQKLGCDFISNYETMVTFFKHPSRSYKVYATIDICHMLKLARNALGDLKIFKSSKNKNIEWKFIYELFKLQEEEGFTIVNHVKWQKQKMKVKLAAQTFSSSVADALEFLMKDMKLPKFADCFGTIEFIRNIDRLFDILNSRLPFAKGFKSPLNLSNIQYKEKIIKDICYYLLSLQDNNNKPFINHRRKTFVIGFVSTAKSIIMLTKELLN